MKNLFTLFFCSIATHLLAQTPFLVTDSIDVNNLNAMALVHGDMWWEPGTYKPHCNFPNGSVKNVGFAASLWLSGYDDAGQLHVAAQTYRQDGNDYWPGPLDGAGNLDYATSSKWAKIWKVTRAEINLFRSISLHTISNTPESILRWPANGNTYAQGKDGVPLDISRDMAPFVDLNGDGKYQPQSGEYPDVRGEQALWWVFSDNGPTHTQTNGVPLKVEVRVLAYAYKRNTLIDNVVYYDYEIVNRSADNFHNFRLALWSDVDLGYYLDDYICFDSARRMGITYNATNDDGASAGHPANSYGLNPPASGVTLLSIPGDAATSYVPAGSFTYYNNDPSVIGNPTIGSDFNNYMRSRMRNGSHFQQGGVDVDYVFSGDPMDTTMLTECSANNNPGDRRYILASGDFAINAGETKRLIMALVVRDSAGGCPDVDLAGIKEVADTAWAVYHNPPPPILVPEVTTNEIGLKIYPNPAHDELHIDCSTCTTAVWVSIYNALGQQVYAKESRQNSDINIDISKYPAGMYFLRHNSTGGSEKIVFVKE
jgi:hypothetical protein